MTAGAPPQAPSCQGGGAPSPLPPASPAPAGQVWAKLVASVREDKPSLASILEASRASLQPDGSWKVLCARAFDVEQVRRGAGLIEAKLATISGGVIRVTADVGAGPAEGEVIETGVPVQDAPAAGEGVWKDVNEAAAKPTKGSSALTRAEKILGGTTRIIKKKSA